MKPYGNQEKYEKGKEAGEYKDSIALGYLMLHDIPFQPRI